MQRRALFLISFFYFSFFSCGCLVASAGFPFFKGKEDKKVPAKTTAVPSPRKVAGSPPGKLLKTLDSKEEQERFVRLATERDLARKHVQALREISIEKQTQLQQANKRLQDDFAVFPDRDYEFDATQGIVYRVSKTVRESVLVLPKGERRDSFLQLVQLKTAAKQSLPVLSTVLQEKRVQAERVSAELEWRFGLLPNQDFYYDGKRGAIYLLQTSSDPSGK